MKGWFASSSTACPKAMLPLVTRIKIPPSTLANETSDGQRVISTQLMYLSRQDGASLIEQNEQMLHLYYLDTLAVY